MTNITEDELIKKIGKRCFIAIDGTSGSGKSTLAEKLKNKLGAQIIHMDDFFLRPEQRTAERFSEIGGNIDYERFIAEVLEKRGCDIIEYGKFNCAKMCIDEKISVKTDGIIVVEGVYSLHPKFLESYDLKVMLKISREEQLARILKRSGKQKLERYINEWIPLEDRYFKEFDVANKADYVVYGGDGFGIAKTEAH